MKCQAFPCSTDLRKIVCKKFVMTNLKRLSDTGIADGTHDCNDGGTSTSSSTNENTDVNTNTGSLNSKRKYGCKKPTRDSGTLLLTKDKKLRQSQACDRCRLKKIKCDGLKPSCSQCLRVNFKCSTSDRLTRRGFPRGYTEMLEKEVVRLQKMLEGVNDTGSVEEVKCSDSGVGPVVSLDACPGVGAGADAGAEPQFPFINDTFHYYNNYRSKENFLGHCTWNLMINLTLENSKSVENEPDWLNECHLSALINYLQLDDTNFCLPKFLVSKYKNDSKKLRKLVFKSISHFSKFQNSLVPLLQPFDIWENKLKKLLTPTESPTPPDPLTLVALIYIIQLYWSCVDESKLFQLTKMICSSKKTSLEQLQVLLLASSYFMGGLTGYSGAVIDNKLWSTELLHQSFSKVLDLGLYINSNRLVPTSTENSYGINYESRLITFWSFQFLDSLWSLFQGLPKVNFLVDEFHPQSISALNNSSGNSFLKPFVLLSNLIVASLDGCNLLDALSDKDNHGKSQLIYSTESFRKILKKLKLYHHLQDHENDIDFTNLKNAISLTKPDIVEIQLTLFYLIISFFTEEVINDTSDKTKNSTTNLEDIAYEILSLYYLLMIDDSHLGQPAQLNIGHILPCNNIEIINACIHKLNIWSISMQDASGADSQLSWKYNKYKTFLTQWCQLFYFDETNNPFMQQAITGYKLHLKPNNNSLLKDGWNKREYLSKVEQFNKADYNTKRPNLLRVNSNAVMDNDQFDMFSHSNSMKHFFNSEQSGETFPQQSISKEDDNIIDISTFKSQILIPNVQSDDDGYAEDDDEDEDDEEANFKPLEIPFRTKRAGSLFQNKHNLPPLYHQTHSLNKKDDQDESLRSKPQSRRRTLDHIILGNKSFISEDGEPPAKMRHLSVDHENTRPTTGQTFSSYDRYSLIPSTKKPASINGGSSSTTNSGGVTLPPPPPVYHDPLMHHSLEFTKGSMSHLNTEAPKNAPNIVETPRAFVDMLLLPSPSKSATKINHVPSQQQLANGNNIFERS